MSVRIPSERMVVLVAWLAEHERAGELTFEYLESGEIQLDLTAAGVEMMKAIGAEIVVEGEVEGMESLSPEALVVAMADAIQDNVRVAVREKI